MRRPVTLWVLAFFITVASAVYQRMTGPSYPLRGQTEVGGREVRFRLPRTQGDGDAEVRVATPVDQVKGTLAWKRYKTNDNWTYQPMQRQGNDVVGQLPHQPPAGKLAYRVILEQLGERVTLGGTPVVIRFKGEVPMPILVIHIICMFCGMLFSTRAGLAAFTGATECTRMIFITFLLLTVGGLLMGPIVQKCAFDAYWTGWPFGTDLTDNKTVVVWLAWALAWMKSKGGGEGRIYVKVAAVLTIAVFCIPHSLFGSELKY